MSTNSLAKKLSKKRKISTMAISVILLLCLSTLSATICIVNAQSTPRNYQIATNTYVSASPNPIGVGQDAFVYFMLHMPPPTAQGAYGDRWTFTLQITTPDGRTENVGPLKSDPVGGSYYIFKPQQIGTYTLQATFPGQKLAGDNLYPGQTAGLEYIGDYFEPSTSQKVTLTVQQNPIEYSQLPAVPNSNQYWERPISSQNSNWWTISGNWLTAADPFPSLDSSPLGFQPYSYAPNTAHIVWTKPLMYGGMVGGELGVRGQYNTGMSYEQFTYDAVILNGILFYNEYSSRSLDTYRASSSKTYGTVIGVDLRTGQEVWRSDNMKLSMGQTYQYDSPNQHGTWPLLWDMQGSTWRAFNAMNGKWEYTLQNVPSGTNVFAKDGSILRYRLTSNKLSLWNSSSVNELLLGPYSTDAWQWRPYGKTVNATSGIEWTVSVPEVPGQSISRISDGVIIANALEDSDTYPHYTMTHVGYNATTGAQMWKKVYPWHSYAVRYGPAMEGVYTLFTHKDLTFQGYDVFSGELLWESEPLDSGWDLYSRNFVGAYGKIFSSSQSGIVYAIDIHTGKRAWTYFQGSAGFDNPYGHYPFLNDPAVADGKIFITNSEHSSDTPLFKDYQLLAIDTNNGKLVWNMTLQGGTYEPVKIADGFLVATNIQDNSFYCFGKGKTATSVTASPKVSVSGSSVLIEGSVTDQSPGAVDTPAIADEYMTPWMEYIYQQQPKPANAAGVVVKLKAIDPNGNTQDIGTTTSDINGLYSKSWSPPTAGKYTVIAEFAGSGSYYPSSAETAFAVDPAPVVKAPETPAQTVAPEVFYAVTAILAILIVVAIVLILKKK